jgi:hypothetical protein
MGRKQWSGAGNSWEEESPVEGTGTSLRHKRSSLLVLTRKKDRVQAEAGCLYPQQQEVEGPFCNSTVMFPRLDAYFLPM